MRQISLRLPASLTTIETAILGESMSDLCVAHSVLRTENNDNAPWVLEWMVESGIDTEVVEGRIQTAATVHGLEIPETLELTDEKIEDKDWLSYSYKQFPPFSVGPFFIYGSHCDGDVPTGQMGLQIDAATAFGSGEHGTTKGCLQAMLDLKGQGACPWNVLDMGTGSGILTVAAWKLWKTPVMAVDNDPESIAVTTWHLEANGVPQGKGNVRTLVSEGFAEDGVPTRGPYDLILANILPAPLKAMAKNLTACADDNGTVILSGILNEQAQGVLDVYLPLGMEHRKTLENAGWSTLVLRKAPV